MVSDVFNFKTFIKSNTTSKIILIWKKIIILVSCSLPIFLEFIRWLDKNNKKQGKKEQDRGYFDYRYLGLFFNQNF